MLELITNQQEINNLVFQFRTTLKKQLGRPSFNTYATRTGQQIGHEEFYWSQKRGLWMAFNERHDTEVNRFWTAFGLERPEPELLNKPDAEINFQSNINLINNYAGAFAKDVLSGDTFVVHIGKIQRKHRGIFSYDYFFRNYKLKSQDIGGKRYAIIGSLQSKLLVEQVRDFVEEVIKIKETER